LLFALSNIYGLAFSFQVFGWPGPRGRVELFFRLPACCVGGAGFSADASFVAMPLFATPYCRASICSKSPIRGAQCLFATAFLTPL
jgi:hypothetical protein